MRHWLWLTIALAGALTPGTVLAQDEDEDASKQSESASKKGADDEGAESDEGAGAKPRADEDVSAEASAEANADIDFDAGADAKPKRKGKRKPPPPKDEQVGGTALSAGVLVGWGFQPWYHLAAGLRVGADIGELYVGGTVVYAFGQTIEDKSRIAGFTFKDSGNFMLFGGEVGYNVDLEDFAVRPFLGVGAAVTPRESCDPSCEGDTGVHAYVAPGATLLYPIDPIFIGLDARYNVVLGLTDGSGAMLSATAGMKF